LLISIDGSMRMNLLHRVRLLLLYLRRLLLLAPDGLLLLLPMRGTNIVVVWHYVHVSVKI
jgi:hypothetical protein